MVIQFSDGILRAMYTYNLKSNFSTVTVVCKNDDDEKWPSQTFRKTISIIIHQALIIHAKEKKKQFVQLPYKSTFFALTFIHFVKER